MKKLIIIVFAVVLFTSCSKENEEPTPTEMIVGKWRLETRDGINAEADLVFNTYYSDGEFVYSSPIEFASGIWRIEGDYIIVDFAYYSTMKTRLESVTANQLIEIQDGRRLKWVKVGN